jgi:hypothetical protein
MLLRNTKNFRVILMARTSRVEMVYPLIRVIIQDMLEGPLSPSSPGGTEDILEGPLSPSSPGGTEDMPEGPLFPSSPGGLTIASLYFKLAD